MRKKQTDRTLEAFILRDLNYTKRDYEERREREERERERDRQKHTDQLMGEREKKVTGLQKVTTAPLLLGELIVVEHDVI